MPENLAESDDDGTPRPSTGWDYAALGENLTPQQFLNSSDKQAKIISYQLTKIYQ